MTIKQFEAFRRALTSNEVDGIVLTLSKRGGRTAEVLPPATSSRLFSSLGPRAANGLHLVMGSSSEWACAVIHGRKGIRRSLHAGCTIEWGLLRRLRLGCIALRPNNERDKPERGREMDGGRTAWTVEAEHSATTWNDDELCYARCTIAHRLANEEP
jgi:hypothetical protein